MKLTERQRQVVVGLARSETIKGIASRLGLSPKTVEAHKRVACHKLGLEDIAGLTRWAIRMGYVVPLLACFAACSPLAHDLALDPDPHSSTSKSTSTSKSFASTSFPAPPLLRRTFTKTLTLAWGAVDGAEYYTLYSSTNGSNFAPIAGPSVDGGSVGGGSVAYPMTNLFPQSHYWFYVTANAKGADESLPSNQVQWWNGPYPPPPMVVSLQTAPTVSGPWSTLLTFTNPDTQFLRLTR
jgi:DNA-binding CsgD family transcriptional regulator